MKAHTAAAVLIPAFCLAVLCAQPAIAAKRIDLWDSTSPKPAEEPGTGAEGTTEQDQQAADETPQDNRPAQILEQAAKKQGLTLVGDLVLLSAESLQPPAEVESASEGEAEPEAEPAPEGEAAPDAEATLEEKPAILSSLPSYLTREPFDDYGLVAGAGGEFTHPGGQTLRAVLFEFDSAADAWGLWSVGRGEKSVMAGQAASFGPALRVWQGQFAAVLSLEPADERLDEIRLSKFARVLFAGVPGRGAAPEMASWLPSGNQVAHTVTYFHANAPAAGDTLQLSPDTEGVSAIYQIGERGYRALIVRYPDREAALAAWAAFVEQVLGLDPTSGDAGGRRRAPVGGTWSGVRTKGRVGAFVLGAATRNQAEIMLAQTCARAHD
jgi:hypothetical protein